MAKWINEDTGAELTDVQYKAEFGKLESAIDQAEGAARRKREEIEALESEWRKLETDYRDAEDAAMDFERLHHFEE